MSTAELKKDLITKIAEIDDISFLNALKTILDSRQKSSFIDLTIEDEEELSMASQQGRDGNFIEQSEMDLKVGKWLKGE